MSMGVAITGFLIISQLMFTDYRARTRFELEPPAVKQDTVKIDLPKDKDFLYIPDVEYYEVAK